MLENESRVPRVKLVCTLEEANDLAVIGIRRHPIPGFRREGWRACFDDSMKSFGNRAIRSRHRGNQREHVTFVIRLVPSA